MLDHKGFDLWADGYDEAVGLSDEQETYPFAGYKGVLARIYQLVTAKNNAKILDIGFGTGVLTAKLYEQGCEVWGQDFSHRMIELASSKMQNAHLFQGDFSQSLAEPILRNSYDFIIATYSLHHLTDDSKIELIKTLLKLLKKDGIILIGDVAFLNSMELEQCRELSGDEWDDEEYYFVYTDLQEAFPTLKFERISYCAGVLSLFR